MASGGKLISSVQITDVILCSICLETFKEPRALPCIHTFCLQCLNKHCEKDEQKEVLCPLCRKVFRVPQGGNKNLPRNFFIDQLLQLKECSEASANEDEKQIPVCDVCSEYESEIYATSYCVECEQHICDRCSLVHARTKALVNHKVIPLNDLPSKNYRMKLPVNYCSEHPKEAVRFFCCDCKEVICCACFVEKHEHHKLTDVNKSAEKFRTQLKEDVYKLSDCSLKKRRERDQLEADTKKFIEHIINVESKISQKCEELVSLIQSHKKQLIGELHVMKEKMLKKVETVKDEIERQIVITESFKRYCEERMDKGTACDISRTAHDLHAKAEELVKKQAESGCQILRKIEITFQPGFAISASRAKELLGQVITRGVDLTMFLNEGRLLHVMASTGHPVTGITVLGNDVYVVRDIRHVDVYDSTSFTLNNCIIIPGSKQLRRIVSCSLYDCLYMTDYQDNIVCRYDITNKATVKWSIKKNCRGLSVTKYYNLLVTSQVSQLVQEYTTHGSLIREIDLDKSINYSNHCVQLSSGNIIVCHAGGKKQRVCLVDLNNCLIQSYGTFRETSYGQLNVPCHLAVDALDNVLVADCSNNSVQLLCPTFYYLGDIMIPGYQLNEPFTLHFDEQNYRLYIGELGGKRLFVLGVGVL